MKWVAGILMLLVVGLFSQYQASQPQEVVFDINITKHKQKVFVPLYTKNIKQPSTTRTHGVPVGIFKIDTERLTSLQKGDKVLLDSISGHLYTLTMTRKHYFKSYTEIYFRHTDQGQQFEAMATINQTNAFMVLYTAQGIYEMEAKNDIAYFYKRTMSRRKSN